MNPASDPSDETLAVASQWQFALQVAALLAIDPAGLAGVRVRAAAGPVRDAWLSMLRTLMGERPWKRMPVNISDERLLGGLDLSATLSAGRPVLQQGLLTEVQGGALVLTMAERLPAATGAKLAQVIDSGEVVVARDGLHARHDTRFAVIALDEGAHDDEALMPTLRERLAFDLDLRSVPWTMVRDSTALISTQEIEAARARLSDVQMPERLIEALCGTTLALGIGSARAALMAIAAARASAALDGNDEATDDDARLAAALVLAPRATRLPPVEPEPEPEQERESEPEQRAEQQPPDDESSSSEQAPLEDRVLDAAKAAIPAGLLSQLLDTGVRRRGSSGKSGAAIKAGLRGRPAGSRRAPPAQGSRLHLIDTLRAAAPWQRLRKAAAKNSPAKIQVRAEDFHVARIKQKTATTTLFVVDASGSSALHRLAEAKGAVELLLADCYVRRDQVALIAFRGQQAELLLPPTRSLVRAKRSLSGLPGGGGTPLATAIDATIDVAEGLARRGQSPVIVMLTDGRANVARNGSGGRELAQTEAMQAARKLAALEVPVLFIDTSPRPQQLAAELAAGMRARYLPLPHAGAATVSQAVRSVTSSITRTGAP